MGLDTSHDCWHGSYNAFQRWRDKLAEVAGYTFHDCDKPSNFDIDWGNIEATIGRDLMGKWPRVPVRPDGTTDALIVLLAHSDCGGGIQVDMLLPLADRLEELLPELDKQDGGGHIGNYGDKTRQFIVGLREAYLAREVVDFH